MNGTMETMRVLTIAVLLCTALALPAATAIECEGQKKHCLKLGGNLASVHSLPEYRLIQKFTAAKAWIGGHDAVEEGQWLWSDGSPFLYTKWTPRQPDNHNEEDCLCINYKGMLP
ncbi:ladderlectin-like [Megalops cyprinoides]|uniref:ladderlectin-like n=1 Tax=Megalops cyprinoides TaxID=118141 RepID=UPI0018647B16|nr:ladderlectin-like [Megalops cyprinoides]